MPRDIDPDDAVEIYRLLDGAGIPVWVDGGWGVDALLGRPTRRHADLDIAVRRIDFDRAIEVLAGQGFELVRDDGRHNLVVGDARGRLVDVHAFDHTAIRIDADGIRRHDGDGLAYEVDGFDGRGTIAGRVVRCIAPATMIRYHTGYQVDADDWHDVRLLCERFDLPVPDDYERFAHLSDSPG